MTTDTRDPVAALMLAVDGALKVQGGTKREAAARIAAALAEQGYVLVKAEGLEALVHSALIRSDLILTTISRHGRSPGQQREDFVAAILAAIQEQERAD